MGNIAPNRWERVKELFAAASHMTPPERSSFLPGACEGDRTVLAEVERLLRQHDQAGDFLESGNESNWLARLIDPHAFNPGDLVSGRFRIVCFVGRGGMGEVYEAEDQELGQPVALKTIRSEVAADERVIARFKQEIHLSRKVTHPNVCRIYDKHEAYALDSFGVEGKVTYLTMELLPGEGLSERLRRNGRMTTAEALPIVLQLISGLQAAHDAGIVHGDLKSSNVILVESEGGKVRAVITDFGLARLSAVAGGSEKSLPAGGTGTPAYMSPEQVERAAVTTAADIYSFGVVIFEMVTGRLPFVADTPTLMASKRLKEDAPSPRSIVPDLDRKWDRAILRCLQRNPQDRFHMAIDIADALRHELHVETRNRGRRVALGIGAGILLLPLSLGGYRVWRLSRPEHKVELAQARIRDGLARQDAGDAKQAEALFEEARHLNESAGNQAGVAEVLTKEGDLLSDEGNFTGANTAYQSAIGIAREIGDQQRIGIVLANLAIALRSKGDEAAARKNYQSALEIFRNIGDKRHIAIVLKNLGDFEGALAIFKEIGYKRGAANTLDSLGVNLDAEGYLIAARKAFEEELSMWRDIDEPGSEGYARGGAFNLGCVLYEQGYLSDGRKQFESALQVARKLAPTGIAGTLYNLGELLLQQDLIEDARKAAEEALALGYKFDNQADVGGARLLLAKIALVENRPSEAEAQAKQAIERFRTQKPLVNEVPATAVLALAFLAQRKRQDARTILQETVLPAIEKETVYSDRLSLSITVGKILAATGNVSRGTKYLESALDDSRRLGYMGNELDARLSLAELELRSGSPVIGRTRLIALERDARSRGYELIARKAKQAIQIAGVEPQSPSAAPK
jgi:tetratricopeptide (TPR) repeat protein